MVKADCIQITQRCRIEQVASNGGDLADNRFPPKYRKSRSKPGPTTRRLQARAFSEIGSVDAMDVSGAPLGAVSILRGAHEMKALNNQEDQGCGPAEQEQPIRCLEST
jgi:hypothetical protein